MCRPSHDLMVPLPSHFPNEPPQLSMSESRNGMLSDFGTALYGGPPGSEQVRDWTWPQVMTGAAPYSVPDFCANSRRFSANHPRSWQQPIQNVLASNEVPGGQFPNSYTPLKPSLKRGWSNFQQTETASMQPIHTRGVSISEQPPASYLPWPASGNHQRCLPHPSSVSAITRGSSGPLLAPPMSSENTWRPMNGPWKVATSTIAPQYNPAKIDEENRYTGNSAPVWKAYGSALARAEGSDEFFPQSGPEVEDEENYEDDGDAQTQKRIRRTLSNRESAKRSRQRRQERLKELEHLTVAMRADLSTLGQHHEEATRQVAEYKLENDMLHVEVDRLQSQMRAMEEFRRGNPVTFDCLPVAPKTENSLLGLDNPHFLGGEKNWTAKMEPGQDLLSNASYRSNVVVPKLPLGGGQSFGYLPNVAEVCADKAGGAGCSDDDVWFHDLVMGFT